MEKKFTLGKKSFNSRLILGSGKFRSLEEGLQSVASSRCELITVAVRRVYMEKNLSTLNLIESLNWGKISILPNTAGAATPEQAIRLAYLGRELAKSLGQTDNSLVKLEVISDPKYLLPDPIGTLKAAEYLVEKGFSVLPYINADPVLAKHLENIGCAAVMPLASPIGSGQGLKNHYNIGLIIDNCDIPVIIDAGIGTPSDATQVMELGASAVLTNTAIASAKNPSLMAAAMKMAVDSGHSAFKAKRMKFKSSAVPSSPSTGILF